MSASTRKRSRLLMIEFRLVWLVPSQATARPEDDELKR